MLLLFHILFIPLIYCSNASLAKTINRTQSIETHVEKVQSATKLPPVLTEGGVSVTNEIALAKEKQTSLLALANGVGDNKQNISTVKARKGVVYNSSEDVHNISEEKPVQTINKNTTVEIKVPEKLEITHVSTNSTTSKPLVTKITSETVNATTVKMVTTLEPHKPTRTSYDELANAVVKSSPETAVNQLPSPNRGTKVYASANNHPGMVMPIVITILLVPMFAVLGYMALRRGQEAWKNRHYKRMDFLLDGMYND